MARLASIVQAILFDLDGTLIDGARPHAVYDGVAEMLRGLRSAGIPLGVVTGKGRAAWEATERELDLGPFQGVVTDDDAEHPEPHPGGLLAAAAALGADPARTVYLGDSRGDVLAARAAGMPAAVALWPKTGPGEAESFLASLPDLAPEWVFERPSRVTRTFAAWC